MKMSANDKIFNIKEGVIMNVKSLNPSKPHVVTFGHFRKPFGNKDEYTVFTFDGGEYFIFLGSGQKVPPEGQKVWALFEADNKPTYNKQADKVECHANPRFLKEILTPS